MKSIFDSATRAELIRRVESIHADTPPLWGKMNAFQMARHCTCWNEMVLGKLQVKRMFLGRIFGKIALKGVLKNDHPLAKNTPTSTELTVTEKTGNIAAQKKQWIDTINAYAHFSNTDFIHPFFGTMTREQIGLFVYKHTNHHLNQFGA